MHRKLADSGEESIGLPCFNLNRNVDSLSSVSLNIVPYSGHNDSYLNPFGGYSPGIWYPNTIGQVQLPSPASANMGYQPTFFHIQNKINSRVRTKTITDQWNYVAESPFWIQNFMATPNYYSEPAPYYTPYEEMWQKKPATLKDVQTKRHGKRAVQDAVPINEGLITPQGQMVGPHCKIKDLDTEVSSTEVKEENLENEKVLDKLGQKSPIVEHDKPLVTSKSLERKNKEDDTCITRSDLNKPSKSSKSKKKITESDVTSEDERIACNGWQSGNGESTSQNPNPNGRRPSVSIISERSSSGSVQIKEGGFFIDSMLPATPTETEQSDKSITSSRISSPASQHSLSLATSTSDFVLKFQASSESNFEVREFSCQESVTVQLPASDLSLKPTVLKTFPFIVEPMITEDPWNIVKSRKKQKQDKAVTTKSYNSNSSQLSDRKLSNSPLETKKKCRHRMKKKKFKYSEPTKPEKVVSKEKVKPKCFFKTSGATLKSNRESSCDMFKEYLFRIIKWCRRGATLGELMIPEE